MLDLLKGRKTYLVSALMAIAVYAHINGWLDQHQTELIQQLLLPAGLAALRSGVAK